MAFVTKKDYCGLAVTGKLVCSGDTMGASSSDVQATDDYGSVVAFTTVGGGKSPSNTYDVVAAVPFTSTAAIKLGTVITVGTEKFMLVGVNFGTSAGAAPTFSASAVDVESGASTGDVCALPGFTMPKTHKAAFLFEEATIGGTGCNLVGTAYSASVTPGVTRDEVGVPESSDWFGGVLTSTVTVNQTGTAEPTLTPADGWHVDGALTQTNSKGAYPTWTATLTKYLTRTTPTA